MPNWTSVRPPKPYIDNHDYDDEPTVRTDRDPRDESAYMRASTTTGKGGQVMTRESAKQSSIAKRKMNEMLNIATNTEKPPSIRSIAATNANTYAILYTEHKRQEELLDG